MNNFLQQISTRLAVNWSQYFAIRKNMQCFQVLNCTLLLYLNT